MHTRIRLSVYEYVYIYIHIQIYTHAHTYKDCFANKHSFADLIPNALRRLHVPPFWLVERSDTCSPILQDAPIIWDPRRKLLTCDIS